jgi:signal transduction histidine kinase
LSSNASPSTFAKARIERVIGRVFSLAALGMSVAQIFLVAIPHLKYGNPAFLMGGLGLIVLAQLAAVFTFWFGSANKNVYLLHGFAYVVAFFTYLFSIGPEVELSSDYRSWLWWWTGTATIAMTMFLPKWWSYLYLVFVPVSYLFLRMDRLGGGGNLGSALLDATYIVLYALAIQALVGLLRTAAAELDATNDAVSKIAVERASLESAQLERQKLDELVHDQVLTTILVAARADTPEKKAMAGEVAAKAIERLQAAATESVDELQEVSASSFVDSLAGSLTRGYPNIPINLTKEIEFTIPIAVGIALADATIQAMTNSVQHAGVKAERAVRIKVYRQGLKIVVMDNGRGFWESRIPNDRLGIRNSIRRRATAVGAVVRIKSAPRKGTSVVLIWSPNA